jgi:hypothetical protein
MLVFDSQPPTSETSGLFPITADDRRRKGHQKMHGLALYINWVWAATIATETSICREHGVEIDCERVALAVSPALAAIRTLDLDIFDRGQGSEHIQQEYRNLRKSDPHGRVVRGLLLLRNADIHLSATIDLRSERAISLFDGNITYWRVFPQWQPYDELDPVIRTNPGTREQAHECYRSAVSGQLVIESLLDAFCFFDRCDPSLAVRRMNEGSEELAYFPLPAFVQHDYERRHPYAISRDEAQRRLCEHPESTPPGPPA